MTNADVGRARQVAQKIVQNGGFTPPISVMRIARDHGVVITYRELDSDVAGVIAVKGALATIVVNKLHSPLRQRFTIAHELGHWLLSHELESVHVDGTFDSVDNRDKDSATGEIPREIEANAFASELLMPEDATRRSFSREALPDGDDITIQRLARQFEVSVQAMTIRLVTLGLLGY